MPSAVPSAPRPAYAPSVLRRVALAAVCVAAGMLATLSSADAVASRATGTSLASAADRARSTLTLASQTSWVDGRSGMTLRLEIGSRLPVSELGLKFVLYSRLTTRSAFEESLGGVEAPSEIAVESPVTIPLARLGRHGPVDGLVTVHFHVTTAATATTRSVVSPTLGLSCGDICDGVYPLEAALVDTASTTPLATLTTHLVYAPAAPGLLPLGVSLVLPAGTTPALASTGSPTLDARRIASLDQLFAPIAAHPGLRLTVALYPQLLVALERDRAPAARHTLALVDRVLAGQPGRLPPARHELLGTTFAPADPAALSRAGLGDELATQLARGTQSLEAGLHRSVGPSPFVVYGPLDARALRLLERSGVSELVLPSQDVTTLEGTAPLPVARTSPFGLDLPASGAARSGPATGARPPVALVADPGLAAHFTDGSSDPVLAAHQLLADLAEIYFDAPSDPQRRGVVVAPRAWQPSAAFLSTVLGGLVDSPVLATLTVGEAFSALPVGGNGSPASEQLVPGTPAATVHASAIGAARRALATLQSVLPGDKTLLAHLGDDVLLAQTTGLGATARHDYSTAPVRARAGLARLLHLSGGRIVTLTSRTGDIPIGIVSSSRYPVHALVELRDPSLAFAGSDVGPLPVTFGQKTTTIDYRVTTRTSGASRLDVEVVAPVGGTTLLDGSFSVHATAVSGVAVALSAGALLVLGVWWLRSVLRHRRQAAAARRSGAAGDSPVVT